MATKVIIQYTMVAGDDWRNSARNVSDLDNAVKEACERVHMHEVKCISIDVESIDLPS